MNGAEMIAAERERQVTEEGWTPEHDAEHKEGELARAAVRYLRAGMGVYAVTSDTLLWPWDESWFKPSRDRVRNLVKAGALIAAEIDRLMPDAPPAEKETNEPSEACCPHASRRHYEVEDGSLYCNVCLTYCRRAEPSEEQPHAE